jgi:F0F1-type ATP synthase epsilon subunit
MNLRIATTDNAKIFDEEIQQVVLPWESGEITLYGKSIPTIVKLVPWIIQITTKWWEKQKYSISKGIALVDTSSIKVTVSMATERPLAKLVELRWTLNLLELKLQKVRSFGSVEEISNLIWEVEKIKADIQLAQN